MPKLQDFSAGDHVELHPATDRWMMGDRSGKVLRVGRTKLTVKMGRSQQTIRVNPLNIGRRNGVFVS